MNAEHGLSVQLYSRVEEWAGDKLTFFFFVCLPRRCFAFPAHSAAPLASATGYGPKGPVDLKTLFTANLIPDRKCISNCAGVTTERSQRALEIVSGPFWCGAQDRPGALLREWCRNSLCQNNNAVTRFHVTVLLTPRLVLCFHREILELKL